MIPSDTVTCLRAPICVWWDITRRCNLACQHCFSDSGRSGQPYADNELNTAEARNLIEQLGRMEVFKLYFLGGEPLLRGDFLELLDDCREHDVDPLFTTNGWLVDAWMAERIRDTGVHTVNVSLDGATASTHDRIRGRVGSFARAGAAVRHLAHAGVPQVGVIQTGMRANIAETAALIDLAAELGAATFQCVPLARCGRAAALADDMGLTRADAHHVRAVIADKREALAGRLAVTFTGARDEDDALCHMRQTGDVPDFMGCHAGRTQCNIDANGDVIPCSVLRRPVAGSVRERPLSEIWETSAVFKQMRRVRDDVESCRACKFKQVCARECPLSPTQDRVSSEARIQQVEELSAQWACGHGQALACREAAAVPAAPP